MTNRTEIRKTYKLFIGGQFPRSESGRYFGIELSGAEGEKKKYLVNICRSSRKDFRNAVKAARDAFSGWAGKTAYNRGQILYRLSEMLESRKAQFAEELMSMGASKKDATDEVRKSVDLLVQYAGWSDKYQQVFSSVNPVQSKHFDFSAPCPMGVIGIILPKKQPLLSLVSSLAPVIIGGNTAVVLANDSTPLSALTFAEVIGTSDVPHGVVNILSGYTSELLEHFSTHMDINGIVYNGKKEEEMKTLRENSTLNLKRVFAGNFTDEDADPYRIMDCQEIKTTWHPIGM